MTIEYNDRMIRAEAYKKEQRDKMKLMRCWHCGTPMIWGGDHSYEDYCMDDKEGVISNFSCSKCPATALVTLIDEEEDDQLGIQI